MPAFSLLAAARSADREADEGKIQTVPQAADTGFSPTERPRLSKPKPVKSTRRKPATKERTKNDRPASAKRQHSKPKPAVPDDAHIQVAPEAILPQLGEMITSELEYWTCYMRTVNTQCRYADITGDDTTSKGIFQALRYILETLPLRQKALATAYAAPDVNSVESDAQLQALLDMLSDDAIEGELEGWDDVKWLQRKKLRSDVLSLDAEVRRLEEARMEELKSVMVLVEGTKLAARDGMVHKEALTHLIEAMDEVGLSAHEPRKTRAAWVPRK